MRSPHNTPNQLLAVVGKRAGNAAAQTVARKNSVDNPVHNHIKPEKPKGRKRLHHVGLPGVHNPNKLGIPGALVGSAKARNRNVHPAVRSVPGRAPLVHIDGSPSRKLRNKTVVQPNVEHYNHRESGSGSAHTP